MIGSMNNKVLRIAIMDPVGIKAGMDAYDLSMARELESLSCRIDIYSNFIQGGSAASVIEQFDFTFRRGVFQRFQFLIQYISALLKVRRSKADILVLHLFNPSFVNYFLLKLSRIFHSKIFLIVHDLESFVYTNGGSWLKSCVQISAAVIVHNKEVYNEIIEKIGDQLIEKVHVIPHGNFPNLPSRAKKELAIEYFNLSPEKKYLLFFGMIKKSKGLNILLNAMRDIDTGVHLIIAGRLRENSFQEYYKLIKEFGLAERVHTILRYITNEERHLLFSTADISVLPYTRIYQSGVLLLAMSYGVPVVASDLPSVKEVINSENGILFTCGDSKDLASKINMLISDEEKKIRISKNAIDYIRKNHDWKIFAGEFYKLAEKIT